MSARRARGRLAPRHPRLRGLTLVETIIALAIGAFLLLGALTVFVQSRATLRATESIARLQENARFALGALEPDVRMAQYWGLTTRTSAIAGRAGPEDPVALAVSGDCGPNFSVDLDAAVGGTNARYGWACPPRGGARPGADTLVVRRAEQEQSAPAAGRLQLQSARFGGGRLFIGEEAPEGYAAAGSRTHRLVVNGYYVSPTSSLSVAGNDVPSLRMKTLVDGPRIEDREVLPGVEDLQIQFGLDTDPPGSPNRNSVDRYVSPGDPVLDPSSSAYMPEAKVVAVRVWLRLRAERPEAGYEDRRRYVYADRDEPPPNDGFRRLVVSKTIYLRNARPAA